MQIKNKQVIFFDLDGTLIDSLPDLATSLNATLTHFGFEPFAIETVRSWIGGGATLLLQRAFERATNRAVDPDFQAQALTFFLQHYEKHHLRATTLYPHCHSTLEALKEHYTLGLITNKPVRFVPSILETLQIDHYFDIVLGGDSLEEKKPHPLPLLHAIKALHTTAEKSLMIGDTPNDLLCAQASGVDSIAITHGYATHETLRAHNPDYLVENLKQLQERLCP